jgi:hypothetical protein
MLFVHWDVSNQPLMANIVETATDVTFEHRLRIAMTQSEVAAQDRIRTRAPFAKPVMSQHPHGLCHGVKRERV